MPAALSLRSLFAALAPALFVLLWATGFIGAKLGLPYAEPGTFLVLRFVIVVALVAPLPLLLRSQRLGGWRQLGHVAVVGALMHGVYLGGVFVAIDRGMPAGLASLVVALQPLLTAAVVGPLLGDRVRPRQLAGLLLGLLGVALVLSDKLSVGAGDSLFRGFGLDALAFNLAALLGITTATVYQKRFAQHAPLAGSAVVQYLAAAAVVGVPALLFESNRVVWSGELVFALAWLVLVLSIGAVGLLLLLIRWGEAARTASLFYLVPPTTAVIAFLLFDERMGPVALVGMVVTVLGVALVVMRPRGRAA